MTVVRPIIRAVVRPVLKGAGVAGPVPIGGGRLSESLEGLAIMMNVKLYALFKTKEIIVSDKQAVGLIFNFEL